MPCQPTPDSKAGNGTITQRPVEGCQMMSPPRVLLAFVSLPAGAQSLASSSALVALS
jgi:hypothetical protein